MNHFFILIGALGILWIAIILFCFLRTLRHGTTPPQKITAVVLSKDTTPYPDKTKRLVKHRPNYTILCNVAGNPTVFFVGSGLYYSIHKGDTGLLTYHGDHADRFDKSA